jgi:hypothetical protein
MKCDHAEMCLRNCEEGFWMDGKLQSGGAAASPQAPATQVDTVGLIGLNEKQLECCHKWAADSPKGMWGNDESREFNLRTFARAILGLREQS